MKNVVIFIKFNGDDAEDRRNNGAGTLSKGEMIIHSYQSYS